MTEGQILSFCDHWNISAEQYMLVHLVKLRMKGDRELSEQYLAKNLVRTDDLIHLVRQGIFVWPSHKELKFDTVEISDPFMDKVDDSSEWGRELWNNYPPTFPLGGGGMFIARTGMSPENLTILYLDKIGGDAEKHKFVMHQLGRYIHLVKTGKINGNKLSDWVINEMWDTIASIPDEQSFKSDI